ncbi:MAG: hypothetical protein LBJ11_00710 [Oscillospiraceae bacterium]|jgi:hypothetical protein|nr:hypothetical protein [Oscillospiraceae bacterium]
MGKLTVIPVDVINDLYETECAMRNTTAAASAMYELFFERVYAAHEWDKQRYDFASRMFSVLSDQIFNLKEELDKVSAKYEAMHRRMLRRDHG